MEDICVSKELSKNPFSVVLMLILDIGMLFLALFSIGLLAIEWFWPTLFFTDPERQIRFLIYVDYGICLIFFVEFIGRWYVFGWKLNFLKYNWYDILGMIPFSHPALRSFRLLRLIRIFVLISRLKRGIDRLKGDGFFLSFLRKYKRVIVELITDAVIIQVIGVIETILQKGHYQRVIKKALSKNEDSVKQLIREKLAQNKKVSQLQKLPFASQITESILNDSYDLVVGIVDSKEFDLIMKEILQDLLVSMKTEVAIIESLKRAQLEQNLEKGKSLS